MPGEGLVPDGGVSPIPREARPYQGRRAGLVTRLVAACIDGACVGLALMGAYLGLSGVLLLLDPRGFSFPDFDLLFSLTAAFITSVLYLTVAWWLAGRSYGDLVMGLRVLNPWGGQLRLSGAFVRAVFCVVLPVGLLWVAVSRQNRSLQDVVLRTSVVYDWQAHGPASAPAPPG
jgi:uncharacterized RDD family membrane protein YckC